MTDDYYLKVHFPFTELNEEQLDSCIEKCSKAIEKSVEEFDDGSLEILKSSLKKLETEKRIKNSGVH